MKSTLHRLIPFLSFLLNHLRLPSPELGTILILDLILDPRYIASRRTDRKHPFLYCCEGVFTVRLHNTGVIRLLPAYSLPRECLPSRCLAMCISVTIFKNVVTPQEKLCASTINTNRLVLCSDIMFIDK
jgi:hypothetical protein